MARAWPKKWERMGIKPVSAKTLKRRFRQLDVREWADLLPFNKGAIRIWQLELSGVSSTVWNELEESSRRAILKAMNTRDYIDSAIKELVEGEDTVLSRRARAYVESLARLDHSNERMLDGFLRDLAQRYALDSAVELRDVLARELARIKTDGRYDTEGFTQRWCAAKAAALKTVLVSDQPVQVQVRDKDVAALKNASPLRVAATIAGRCYRVSAESVRLGSPRRRRSSSRPVEE